MSQSFGRPYRLPSLADPAGRPDPPGRCDRSTLSLATWSSIGRICPGRRTRGYFDRWSGEHVRRGAGDEAGGQLGPVVVPAVLRDLHGVVRVRLVELLGALPGRRQLVGVPQPVVDGGGLGGCSAAVGGAGCGSRSRSSAAVAASRRVRGRCPCITEPSCDVWCQSGGSAAYLIPEKPMELTIRLPKHGEQHDHRQRRDERGRHQARPSPAPPCGVWDRKTPSATVSTRTFSCWPTSSGQK